MEGKMKIILGVLMLLFLLINMSYHEASALTIVSPIEGEVVSAGSNLTISVEADPGEAWDSVAFGFYPMSYNPITKKYSYTFKIPEDILGSYDRLIVIALDKSGNEVELRRKIFVKLPPNVVLQSILVDDYKTLFKLPPGSTPQEMQRVESRQLRVDGKYSDGVERDVTASTSGTTYTSSDNTVVTVNSEGKMTAQAIGEAKITIRNGRYSAQVDIVVKPYR